MKLFNLLLSPIGRVTSQPMRNIETFSSKQMYLYLLIGQEKSSRVLSHNMDRRRYLVWLNQLVINISHHIEFVSIGDMQHFCTWEYSYKNVRGHLQGSLGPILTPKYFVRNAVSVSYYPMELWSWSNSHYCRCSSLLKGSSFLWRHMMCHCFRRRLI